MSFKAVGKVWDMEGFKEFLGSLPDGSLSWADSVCVHHTAFPDLGMRPKGWLIQHMRNLAHFFGKKKRWSAGPHLFTDEDQVFGLTPVTEPGVHAVSFNRSSIGIEALGNYDKGRDDPFSGRGEDVWHTTSVVVALLLARMGLPANERTIRFHRDDPRTSKSCPGTNIGKAWFVRMVQDIMAELDAADLGLPDDASLADWTDEGSADSLLPVPPVPVAEIRGHIDRAADSLDQARAGLPL